MSAADFRWGLVGPGRIAHRFAEAVQRLPGCRLAAVTGRDAGRAQAFARQWSAGAAQVVDVAPTLATLLARDDIDAVYIATPHSAHADAVRACLLAAKPVLCEKPLAPTAALSRALLALSRERGVFLMEALWTRCLPLYAELGRWLCDGRIGDVRTVQSSFGFALPYVPYDRCFDPAQAGGALLDIGIYNLALSRWALAQAAGACPPLVSMSVHAAFAPSGVDQRLSAQLLFDGGAVAQMFCAFDTVADNSLRIQGERGHIVVPQRFWEGTRAWCQVGDGEPRHIERPFEINGFEGEVCEAMRCIRAGALESPLMPQAESLALAETMDAMRRQIGLRYPFEPADD